ncbi:MAG: CHAD domain-containing protein [Rhodocyclaceae bacterium]|nr:MAG: CHAD domain-containing protein [Rhodocyclaceae bacterium]
MAQEIELKLALPKAAQAQLMRHAVLRKAVSRTTHQLVNLYYDTPGLALRKRGIALRLRKHGRAWLQTVKCAGNAAAGLSIRPEWETPYRGRFDFSGIEAPPIRDWLDRPALRGQIAPLFETNFKRTTWRFEPRPGCVVLLMLDRGWIAAAGKLEDISEVEIELAGDTGACSMDELFKLAQSLGERLPLMPATVSKAERGYRLFQGSPPTPQKAQSVMLGAADAPLEAFRKIALSSLEHLQGNLHGALASNDPEFIHQMRVATRRLRAAMRLFVSLLPAGLAEELVPELRILSTRLGHARDLDVLLTEIATPVMHALPDEPRLAALAGAITDRQHAARVAAMRHLQSIDHGRLVLRLIAALHRPPFLPPPLEVVGLTRGVGEFAAARLKRLRKKVLGLVAVASIDDPVSLHQLRIGIKRLRYALEFFAPLAPGRLLRRVLGELVLMQDELGQLNDLANAGLLLMNCAGNDPRLREAVSLVGGWHASRHKALLDKIPLQLNKLSRLKLPKLG